MQCAIICYKYSVAIKCSEDLNPGKDLKVLSFFLGSNVKR